MKSSGFKPRVRADAQAKGADRSAPSHCKFLDYDHCLGGGGFSAGLSDALLLPPLGAVEGAGLLAPVVVAVLPDGAGAAGVVALPLVVVAGAFAATG